MGIAADSCALLIALLDRPTAGSVLEAVAAGSTESALGTDVSPALEVDGTVEAGTGVIAGAVVSGGGPLQALSASKVNASAMAWTAGEGGGGPRWMQGASMRFDMVPPGLRGLAKVILTPVEGRVARPSASFPQWNPGAVGRTQSGEDLNGMTVAAP